MIRRIIIVSLFFGFGVFLIRAQKFDPVLSMLPAFLLFIICFGDYYAWLRMNEKTLADIEYEYKCGMLDNLSYIERLHRAKTDFWTN